MLQRARIDRIERFRLGLARHFLAQEEIRVAADQGFRQRKRLRQKCPVIDLQGVEPVHALPVIIGRQDIQHRKPRQPAGMIERQAIGDAAAAIMPREGEMHMAELFHRLDDRPRHRTLGVGRMILVALRHVRPAITRQIGDDQREPLGELRRHAVPHYMRLGKAVQQQ